jgi:hypothetical protein
MFDMKKITVFFIICLIILPVIYANDGFEDYHFHYDRGPFRIEDRIFELGLVNFGVNVSNDYITIGEIFSETLVINIDNLANGFRAGLGFNLTPFFLNLNFGGWGFGLFTNVDLVGAISINGQLLSLSEADNALSEVNAAIYASAGISAFFHVHRFKIKVRPAMYYPVVYVKPEILYTFDISDGTKLMLDYGINIFSAFPLDDISAFPESFELTARPGFDLNLGVEVPLSEILGLNYIPILSFDVGLDFINIPIVPSKMRSMASIAGGFGVDEDGNLINILDPDGFSNFTDSFDNLSTELLYSEADQNIIRPFKMLLWANWRPFGTPLFTVTPMIGFSLDALYASLGAIELGIKAKLDLANLFITTFGISYEDRLWRNKLDLVLNLRALELNLGLELQSQAFLKSWNASGVGVNFGLKFGW